MKSPRSVRCENRRSTGWQGRVRAGLVSLAVFLACLPQVDLEAQTADPEREQFKRALNAARSGDRTTFERARGGLESYVLYPYLQYEDLRFRRAYVDPAEMAAFLDAHPDWAFTSALRKEWLMALGQTRQWDALLRYAPGVEDTEIRCYLVMARVERGETAAALIEAQALWVVGKSQPDVCDPAFTWLRKVNGIPPDLAWLRVKHAMEADNSRMTTYISRFLPAHDRVWVERWQQQQLARYAHLDKASQWPNRPQGWDIIAFGLKDLSKNHPELAFETFRKLDSHLGWSAAQRGETLGEIARWSAVASDPDTLKRMHAVPAAARTDAMLEWWARFALGAGNWTEVLVAVALMSDEIRNAEQWRYWDARARLELGDPDYARSLLASLSMEATYYGFLAADYLQRPYVICQKEPALSAADLDRFREDPVILRIEALKAAGLAHWARSEWNLNLKTWTGDERRMAAALATEQGHPELAIWALNGKQERGYYDLRFPLVYVNQVAEQAGKRRLDTAWVLGLMRTESAMAENAISGANARGLMQVLPGTAAQLAKRYGYAWKGKEQLMQAGDNIVFGTSFLRELMDKFGNNPVLVTGAYNAGPGAVKKWLSRLPAREAAIWVETLPYHETRDYIPRVLAFATIYDWRLQKPVQRISTRMPGLDSGSMGVATGAAAFATVACTEPDAVTGPDAVAMSEAH